MNSIAQCKLLPGGSLALLRVMVVLATLPFRSGFAQDKTNAPPTSYHIPTNTIIEFTVPLSDTARISVANSRNPMVYFARAAIAVPSEFSTNSTWPILVVNGTSDGDGSSIRAMRAFTNVALSLGWVVLAADGPYGRPTNDSPPWRYAMLSSVLDHVNKSWTGSRKWPMVSAGFSGGSKWAAVMGAVLSQRGYNLIGVFMGGCNEDLASQAAKLYHPASRYKESPIYLSSGTEDKVATPQQHIEVRQSLIANGFTKVRLETYEGPHLLSTEDLRKALLWFRELHEKPVEQAEPAPETAKKP